MTALDQTGTERYLEGTVIMLAVPYLFVKELGHTGESPAWKSWLAETRHPPPNPQSREPSSGHEAHLCSKAALAEDDGVDVLAE